jgi:hypothetical protein
MTISITLRWHRRTALAVAALSLAAGAVLAQYPGHIDTEKKKEAANTKLRSIAVLEWTGDRERPSATRLVPVSLFDGERLQDGGLYLARPVPLALDSGTEYEVESSGVPQGWFDLDGARQIGHDWFGFGKWKPYYPPAPKKPRTTHQKVTVVGSKPADDRPHFKRREETETPQGGATPDTANNGSANKRSADQQSANDGGSNSTAGASEQIDPNRPRLRRRAQEKAEQAEAAANAPETPGNQADPDRPRLAHGKPADVKDEPKPLELTPAALGQTVAVSDAERADHQTFAYDWKSPEDAANVKSELEAHAAQLFKPDTATVTSSATATHSGAPRTPAGARRRSSAAKPMPPASLLTDVKFSAFALTYGGGATLVMTAHEAAGPRSIALIGAEDIYGKVQVLWSSITDDTHLDTTPRMTLVDAVDPRGDGHADLLFEQRNATDRRFVLYSVGATNAEQVFATDPLPLHPVAQSGE